MKTLTALTALTVSTALLHAQGNPGRNTQQQAANTPQQQQPQRPLPPPEEKTSVTKHTARIGGQQIAYTATAATYIIQTDDGSPQTGVFLLAHTPPALDPPP